MSMDRGLAHETVLINVKNVNAIEKVQERATKIPLSLRNISFEIRLTTLGLTKLSERRVSGHLIEMYNVHAHCTVNGIEKIDVVKNLVNRSENKDPTLRGNSIKIQRESFPAQIRNDFAAAVSG
ncbi:RNA-directed DNA polymerase from mobile element jockey-like [Brachionus plicatilis]|uniref:RNA-directed DNA polymerase from mobile element jockey-like n=1 Tax=Brachionus plicatilis TaxID=10195 RepID=A0A3M7RZ01_BRAPC|nr:RNA-directed DNA polymerase from mobile element jockey-like [Brachionus plicatilis]